MGTGRPRLKDEEKRKLVGVRLDPSVRAELEEQARASGLSMAKLAEGLIILALRLPDVQAGKTDKLLKIAKLDERAAAAKREAELLRAQLDCEA